MNQTGKIALGVGLAAFVMIEIYNAASGVLLVIWLKNREQLKEEGFSPQQIIIELSIVKQDGKNPEEVPVENRLAIGAALAIDGEVLNANHHPTRGNGMAAALVPARTVGRSEYRVFLPATLEKGDELILHLYQLTPTTVSQCEVAYSIINPKRGKGAPKTGHISLSEQTPVLSLSLAGINSPEWREEWTPVN